MQENGDQSNSEYEHFLRSAVDLLRHTSNGFELLISITRPNLTDLTFSGWSTVNLLHTFRTPLPRNTSGGRLLMLDMFVFGFDKLKKSKKIRWPTHCEKSVYIWSFSGSYFPAFGPNTDQKNSEYGHFSRSDLYCVNAELHNDQFSSFGKIWWTSVE